MSEDPPPLTYAGSGVSLDASDAVVERIRAAVTSTHGRQVLGGHGGFAGLYTPSVGDPLIAAGGATASGRRCCWGRPPAGTPAWARTSSP